MVQHGQEVLVNKMLVKKVIEKEVSCCYECPYYHADQDMSATLCWCELRGKAYNAILPDINWKNASYKISEDCPWLKNTNKDKTLAEMKGGSK